MGPTGAGKSTLANVLLGESPNCQNCTFSVCHGLDSCTKETTYGVGNWIGNGVEFTVVDTPGFGDSDNQDVEPDTSQSTGGDKSRLETGMSQDYSRPRNSTPLSPT